MATVSQSKKNALQGYEFAFLSSEGQKRVRPIIAFASVAFALVYFLSLQLRKNYIQLDLASRSLAVLSQADVDVQFFGRDGVVSGSVASKEEASEVIKKVSQVWGVRTVDNQLKVAPENLNTNPVAQQLKETGQVTFNALQFASASTSLNKSAKSKLNDLIAVLLAKPSSRFKISGHTDATGDEQTNIVLSQQRAQAVQRYLLSQGALANQIVTQGYGSSQPIADNRTSAGRSRNRRIEVVELKNGMTSEEN